MKIKINQLTPHPFNRFFGDLPKDEFSSLMEDIKSRGIQTIIDITEDNVIICGHQRIRVLKELGIDEVEARVLKGWTDDQIKEHLIKDNILRRQLNDSQIADAGEELEKIYEGREYQERGEGGKFIDRGGHVSTPVGKTRDLVAKDFGISGRTYDRIKKAREIIKKKEDDGLTKKWKEGKVKAASIVRENKIEERKVEIKNIKQIKGKYNIIYADPPWKYDDEGCNGAARDHYVTMDNKKITNLPIQDFAADDCVLFIWGTYPKLPEVLEVIKAWGFIYKSIGFQWVKLNRSGNGHFFGLGRWTRGNTEPCFIATRGKPSRISNKISQLIFSPLTKHSQKPDVVRHKIVELMGDLPRIELFARKKIEGWDVWGDEAPTETQNLLK